MTSNDTDAKVDEQLLEAEPATADDAPEVDAAQQQDDLSEADSASDGEGDDGDDEDYDDTEDSLTYSNGVIE